MGASASKQKKGGNRKLGFRFTALPHTVLNSKQFRDLSFSARALLFDVAMQFNGRNNGKLVCTKKYLAPLGWVSNETISNGLKSLVQKGLLIQTRQGMMPPCAQTAWFALGWMALDITEGLDVDPKRYRKTVFEPLNPIKPKNGAD